MANIKAPDELIVIASPTAALRASSQGVRGAPAARTEGLSKLLREAGATLQPLFGESEERVRSRMGESVLRAAPNTTDPATFYSVHGQAADPRKLLADLLNEPAVAGAYIKPGGEPPVWHEEELRSVPPASLDAPPAATPDYVARQGYLEVAPGGIDARFAWTRPGGRGDGVRVIDLEWGWNFSHEDLLVNAGGLLDGSNNADTHHGTAVMGEIGGDHNSRGVHGIAPNARLSAISFVGNPSATAIRKAADRLSAGDIILLEIHRAGPRHNFQARDDQHGYIAIEWWPDDFAAILYATSRGIIVIEAAGNGAQDLDDALYSTRPAGFPSTWLNPFNRGNPQCRAILVGAGAPPLGTHGRSHGADRSRLDFSNFGSAVDVQGWGREVTSTGYGSLFNDSTNQQYTDTFSGTSSASPIVVGAAACIQGWLRAAGKPLLTPTQMRSRFRNTGSTQQSEPGRPATQRIGNRPNLRQVHGKLFPLVKVIKEKETKEFKEGDKPLKEFTKEKEKEKDSDKLSKEFDKTKDIKEIGEKNFKEKDFEGGFGGGLIRAPEVAAASFEARIAMLEAAVFSMAQALQSATSPGSHFIDPALRPDVGGASDSNDDDDDGYDSES